MIGAIPGGVDVERAYHLMDMYIQECEQLQTLKEINDLQYQMLFDFCEKAGETHIPSGISADIYACMNYIRSHNNEAIRLEEDVYKRQDLQYIPFNSLSKEVSRQRYIS